MASVDIADLKEAGLTEGEAKAYLALLELESATTGPIVEKSGVARSIIYQILERLVQKGLVSFVVKEKTKYFQPSPPSSILDYIEERKNSLEVSKKKMEELLPKLYSLQGTAGKNTVQVFMGFKGMIAVHEKTYSRLGKGDWYYYMGIPQDQPKHYHVYWRRDHLRRAQAGIEARLLFHPKTPKEVLLDRNKFKLCDARYMPIDINTPVWLFGYKDVTAITLVATNPITIEITSQEIANSFRAYFEEFWQKSEKFGRKV